jgi:hypothetical protein
MSHDDSPRIPGLTEEERLELAALTAPVLRREDDAAMKAKRRRVHIVKAGDPTWTPIGEADGAHVLRGLVKIQELQDKVADGPRSRQIQCGACGKVVMGRKVGSEKKACSRNCLARLKAKRTSFACVNEGCGGRTKRRGCMCTSCRDKKNANPETRAHLDRLRRRLSSEMTPEARTARARKSHENMSERGRLARSRASRDSGKVAMAVIHAKRDAVMRVRDATILRMRSEGALLREIAEVVGIGVTGISAALRRLGAVDPPA